MGEERDATASGAGGMDQRIVAVEELVEEPAPEGTTARARGLGSWDRARSRRPSPPRSRRWPLVWVSARRTRTHRAGPENPTPNATTPLTVATARSVSSVTLSGRIPRSMSVRPETPTNSDHCSPDPNGWSGIQTVIAGELAAAVPATTRRSSIRADDEASHLGGAHRRGPRSWVPVRQRTRSMSGSFQALSKSGCWGP